MGAIVYAAFILLGAAIIAALIYFGAPVWIMAIMYALAIIVPAWLVYAYNEARLGREA